MANYEVSAEVNKIIKEYAERVGCKLEEAVERLVKTADSRKKSLIKYAKENPRPAAKKAKAKKAAPKGTSIAKKAKKAPKAKKQDFSAADEAMAAAQAKAAAKASA